MKLSMLPQPVPNNPTKGAVAPMVARTPVPRAILRPAPTSMRSSCQAMRSFNPSPCKPADCWISVPAACKASAAGLVLPLNCSNACFSVPQLASLRRSRRSATRALRNSRFLAIHTVQVMSEAKASPIITAFTILSACRNIPHGERSCGSSAVVMECSAVPDCAKAESTAIRTFANAAQ